MELPEGVRIDAPLGTVRMDGRPIGYVREEDGRFRAATWLRPRHDPDLRVAVLVPAQGYPFATREEAVRAILASVAAYHRYRATTKVRR